MIDWWSYFACQCFLSFSYFSQAFFCRYFFFKWKFKSIAIAPALSSLNHDSFTACDLIEHIIKHCIIAWIYPQQCCLIYGIITASNIHFLCFICAQCLISFFILLVVFQNIIHTLRDHHHSQYITLDKIPASPNTALYLV